MNILFTSNILPVPETGGVQRVTQLLMSGLEKRGHKCYFLLYVKRKHTHFFHENKPVDNLGDFVTKHNIRFVINQHGPDLFFANTYRRNKIKNANLITCWHSNSGRLLVNFKEEVKVSSHKNIKLYLYLLYKLYRYLSLNYGGKISYNISDAYVLFTNGHIEDFCRWQKIRRPDKLTAIPNPLTFPDIISDEGLSGKENTVLVVARMEESSKRISLCLKIWEKIAPAAPEWKLVIVGDGPNRNDYEDYAKQHSLRNVFFAGQQNPYHYYKKASVFMMTSSCEGFPMTLLEAIQMGVIPVAMDSFSALHEVIEDGVNGFIVADNDVEGFAQTVLRCINDEKERAQMARNAVKNSTRFTLDTVLDQWETLFNRLIRKNNFIQEF